MTLDLSALDAVGSPSSSSAGIPMLVDLSTVYEDPENPRKEFDQEALAELAVDTAFVNVVVASVI